MSSDSYQKPLDDPWPVSGDAPAVVIPEDEPPTNVSPAMLAALAAFVGVLVYLLFHLGNGLAFGPWQGAYLDAAFPYRAPLISLWTGRAVAAIPFGDAARRLSFASVMLGALACAMLALMAARALGARPGGITAACGGVGAGLLFALTPAWSNAVASNSPAMVTVLLSLIGLAFVQHAIETRTAGWLAYGGLAIGFATANDPSFAILFVIALLAALGTLGERISVARVFAPLLCGFAAPVLVPFARSLVLGEGLDGFLAHAMATAYPTIGDGVPRLGFGLELRPQFSWVMLGATLAGMTALFTPGMRGAATTWALLFLAMGPFWPMLTNQRSSAYVLRDTDAATSIASAAVCIGAVWGLAWLARVLARRDRGATITALMACGVAIMVGVQYAALPKRDAARADALARSIFADSGTNAVIVTGDARTTSLLRTIQLARGVRRDLAVVSVHALEQPEWRARLAATYRDELRVVTDFPPDNAWTRWPVERPNEFGLLNATLRDGGLQEGDFRDLLLWEFMRDNFSARPILFAGVTSAWLTARGKPVGMLLAYPREGAGEGNALALVTAAGAFDTDQEMAATNLSLLLPLAEASRRQNDVPQAEKLAALARENGPNNAGAWLSSARAAARGGRREQAVAFSARYLRMANNPREMKDFLGLIEEDLQRNALAVEFSTAAIQTEVNDATRMRRDQLAEMLWGLDELSVLATGYDVAMQIGPGDFELLYERAAVNAQLGELDIARALVGEAVKVDFQKVWSRMQWDGRFYLLEVKRPEFTPGTRG
ncbi:MAG: hypothetical protein SGI88_09005 [Candidatus Hydrogenedentes bacterium]|nr:hypothetical protein [Candidatus Hydrogenedentota bacterium]